MKEADGAARKNSQDASEREIERSHFARKRKKDDATTARQDLQWQWRVARRCDVTAMEEKGRERMRES